MHNEAEYFQNYPDSEHTLHIFNRYNGLMQPRWNFAQFFIRDLERAGNTIIYDTEQVQKATAILTGRYMPEVLLNQFAINDPRWIPRVVSTRNDQWQVALREAYETNRGSLTPKNDGAVISFAFSPDHDYMRLANTAGIDVASTTNPKLTRVGIAGNRKGRRVFVDYRCLGLTPGLSPQVNMVGISVGVDEGQRLRNFFRRPDVIVGNDGETYLIASLLDYGLSYCSTGSELGVTVCGDYGIKRGHVVDTLTYRGQNMLSVPLIMETELHKISENARQVELMKQAV